MTTIARSDEQNMEGPLPYTSAVDPARDGNLAVGTVKRAQRVTREHHEAAPDEQEHGDRHAPEDGDHVSLSRSAENRLEQEHAAHDAKAQLGRQALLPASHPVWMHLTDRLAMLKRLG